MLNSLTTKSTSQRTLPVGLSRSIEQVISAVGESDRIGEMHGKTAAVDFFASKGDDISRAKWQANQLRIGTIRPIAYRFLRTRGSNTLLEALLDDARRWQGVVFSKSARLRGRPGTARHIRTPDKSVLKGPALCRQNQASLRTQVKPERCTSPIFVGV